MRQLALPSDEDTPMPRLGIAHANEPGSRHGLDFALQSERLDRVDLDSATS